jgi:energy-coupling factor transport system permease protein
MHTRQPHSLALLLASVVPALTVVWSVDVLTPVVVGVTVITALFVAIPRVRLSWSRFGAVLAAAAAFGVTSLLYARPDGVVFAEWGLVTISEGSVVTAIASFARILAIAVPAVLIFAAVEPHELIASTVVKRVVPQRAALAALIALRLAPVIVADLDETRIARRAAGKKSGFGSMAVTTLIIAIRRAIRMSEIAEVRGFSEPKRVWTSYRPFVRTDWALVYVAAGCGVFALAVTALTGGWNSAI